jgi:hypothetical protein
MAYRSPAKRDLRSIAKALRVATVLRRLTICCNTDRLRSIPVGTLSEEIHDSTSYWLS